VGIGGIPMVRVVVSLFAGGLVGGFGVRSSGVIRTRRAERFNAPKNKDAQAIHLKLNEIVAALAGASNRLINVEDLTEEEVQILHRHYETLVAIARRDGDLTRSHSVEEAETRHGLKR
jgi:low affinity Fe/Cu permease